MKLFAICFVVFAIGSQIVNSADPHPPKPSTPSAAEQRQKARELEQAIRDSTCVVNGFGNKLCGDDAGAYCDLQWSNLDADSRDACQGLVSQSTLDEQRALDNLSNAP